MEIIAPTPERIAKGGILMPTNTQKAKRDYHRHESVFDRLGRRDVLDGDQVRAGNKLEKHYQGSMGVDVREVDGDSGNPDVECARTYHAQKIAQVEHTLPPRQWKALKLILDGTDELYVIGGAVCQRKQRDMASAAATVLIQEGLDVIVDIWGLKAGQRSRPPSR